MHQLGTVHTLKNDVKNVRMEVVDVSQATPEDFGYASFNIEVVRSLQISVFATSENAIALTSANAYLLDNEDTLQHFALGAKVNQVAFTKDADKSYTLVVVKDGYESYTSEFIYNHFNSKPLEVVLKSALTIALQIPEFSFGNKLDFN